MSIFKFNVNLLCEIITNEDLQISISLHYIFFYTLLFLSILSFLTLMTENDLNMSRTIMWCFYHRWNSIPQCG